MKSQISSEISELKSQIFAVGGIDLSKIETVKNLNFDGVGLLGVLWKDPGNATTNFNKILHVVQNDKKE